MRAIRFKRRSCSEHFLVEVLKLPDTTASIGRSSQTKDGWAYSIMIRRKGFSPALLYLNANGRVLFRMLEAEASGVSPVEFSKARPRAKYRVRARIETDEGYAAAVELARRVYEKALPERE